jgi:cobalt transporter subunit CbtA
MYARARRAIQSVPVVRSEIAGAIGALLLGVFVVFMVGFAGASALHEAAHNTRHSIAFTALIAGTAAGAATSVLQAGKMWPLIAAAEMLEAAGPPHHDHGTAEPVWSPEGPLRPALTVLFNIVAGLGFGLILNALTRLWTLQSGRSFTASDGVLWGAAGFAAFSLAPAFGLPPELPGMAGGELIERQIWWIATGCCTAGGIALLLCLTKPWRSAGIVLIVLPHMIGAPHADGYGAIPGEMAATFAAASLGASAVFWVVLGWVSGWAQQRLIQTG